MLDDLGCLAVCVHCATVPLMAQTSLYDQHHLFSVQERRLEERREKKAKKKQERMKRKEEERKEKEVSLSTL